MRPWPIRILTCILFAAIALTGPITAYGSTAGEASSFYSASGAAAASAPSAAAGSASSAKSRSYDRIHFISLNDLYAASDAILIESNGHFGLVDVSHPSSDPNIHLNRTTVDVDDVIAYLRKVGVKHLDFVLGTHSHSDHIGGMKFLAAARNSDGQYWIDSDTVYFYKEYVYNEREEGRRGWQNSRMYQQAVTAMRSRGAIMVDTKALDPSALSWAGATFVEGGSDPVSDHINFRLGNFTIALYNLYQYSEDNENLNSIVAVISEGDRTALLTADIEINDDCEMRVTDAIEADYGTVDIFKAGHHGYEESNSLDSFEKLQPSCVVTTSNRVKNYYDDEPPFTTYLRDSGALVYRAAEANLALVADFSGSGITYATYNSKGALKQKPVTWTAKMTPGWIEWLRDEDSSDWVYVRPDGSAVPGWQYITFGNKTAWYLLGNGGVLLRDGLYSDGKNSYYLKKDGTYYTGWKVVNGAWHYFASNGAMKTGWFSEGGSWYYFDGDGSMHTGWLKAGKDYYYLDDDGIMQRNQWIERDGQTLFLGKNGAALKGWHKITGDWYYMNKYGYVKTGWLKSGGKWYYLDEDGVMQTGWLKEGGVRYYLGSSGAMQTGWLNYRGKWYNFDPNGHMRTGWFKEGRKWYFLNSSGVMQTGWLRNGGNWYFMDGSGAMQKGWLKVGGKWYFLNKDGIMKTGWLKYGGDWYYLDDSGEMQTGWLQLRGNWYYLSGSGVMQTGWIQYNKNWYYLSQSGVMLHDRWITSKGKKYYLDENGIRRNKKPSLKVNSK